MMDADEVLAQVEAVLALEPWAEAGPGRWVLMCDGAVVATVTYRGHVTPKPFRWDTFPPSSRGRGGIADSVDEAQALADEDLEGEL